MTTRVEVDFNSRDDAGRVPARLEDADVPLRVGVEVEAFDDAGNRCLAVVASIAGDVVALDPIWTSFAVPTASRLVLVAAPGLHARWTSTLSATLSVMRDISPLEQTTKPAEGGPGFREQPALARA
jgi:hypothetical protein